MKPRIVGKTRIVGNIDHGWLGASIEALLRQIN